MTIAFPTSPEHLDTATQPVSAPPPETTASTDTISAETTTPTDTTPTLAPQRTFTLSDMRNFYRANEVTESDGEFVIKPASIRQGLEYLVLPRTLPCPNIHSHRPADLTTAWDSGVVDQILDALRIDEYHELYSSYCRFGRYWYDQDTDRHYLRLTDPRLATHIQLIGVRDCVGAGWMLAPLPVELRITAIAETSYYQYIPYTDELVRAWILHTDFRTREIQEDCAARRALGFALYEP